MKQDCNGSEATQGDLRDVPSTELDRSFGAKIRRALSDREIQSFDKRRVEFH